MTSWFTFGRKKNKNKSDSIENSNGFTSAHAPASGSLADALIFPMQYNGPTYDFLSFPHELLFIPYRDSTTPRHNPSNLFSSAKKLNHKFGATALLIHGNPKNNPTHFMILFHGNGVDLGMASAIWRPLIRALPIHLLIVEYPGYGVMDGRCTCKQVLKVAEHIYQFVTSPITRGGLNISVDKLIILGRSIGTGPASHIAKQKCRTLILVSPFTSIHNLSKDLMGKWTKWMLPKDYANHMDDDEALSASDNMPVLSPLSKTASDSQLIASNYAALTEIEHKKKEHAYDLNKVSSLDLLRVDSYDDDSCNEYKQDMTCTHVQAHTFPDIACLGGFDESPPLLKSQTSAVLSGKRRKKYKQRSRKKVKAKKNVRPKRKKPAFVFNNVTQIEKWQCDNFMVFHGKNDELIPYNHTNTIMNVIDDKRPLLKAKKFLIDGVGHNDVNIQFIGLRIFMQYQDELQSSFEEEEQSLSLSMNMNINQFVRYLDNPPQFDIISNRVQNFNELPYGYRDNSDRDRDEKKIKVINKWNVRGNRFSEYRRDLPSKVYDLSLKLRLDAQKKQIQKANDVIATKWI